MGNMIDVKTLADAFAKACGWQNKEGFQVAHADDIAKATLAFLREVEIYKTKEQPVGLSGKYEAYKELWISWRANLGDMELRQAHRWVLGVMERFMDEYRGGHLEASYDEIDHFFGLPKAPYDYPKATERESSELPGWFNKSAAMADAQKVCDLTEEVGSLRKQVERWHSAAMKAGVIVHVGGVLSYPAICRWQPIETAPKDGTKILVAAPDIDAPVCADWRIANDGSGGWACDEIIWWVEPTHWMHLPQMPENARRG